ARTSHPQTVTVTGARPDRTALVPYPTLFRSYSLPWSFSYDNYKAIFESGTLAFTIARADATVSVVNCAGTYDALSHTASVTISGVGGDGARATDTVSRTNAGHDTATASISGL